MWKKEKSEKKLTEWIVEKAKQWGVSGVHTIVPKRKARIVKFGEKARNEFYLRKEELWKEGQNEINEDLTYKEREARHAMAMWEETCGREE